MENKQKTNAYMAAVLYAIIIGFAFIFVKLTLTHASPLDILAHRFTVSFVAASIPILCGWVRLSFSIKDIVTMLPLALLYPTLFFGLQTFGLVYTSSSEAAILQATAPIFTMVLAAYFLKEYASPWQKASILLSVAGVLFIFIMKGNRLEANHTVGTILILLSVLSLAGYSVLARKMMRKFNYKDLTYVVTAIGFLAFNGMAVIAHVSKGTLNLYFEPFRSPTFVLSILYLGIVASLISLLLSNFALSRLGASRMSAFNNLSTLVTIFAGVLFLKEQLEYFHLLGAVMIVTGVVGANFLHAKRSGKQEVHQSNR
ncbi:transporter [Paenibacillus baekrokdamisoli]|uniref:Transporter n=1 Tax=Paenibacillus baekrokdamisoli TaxID=1712516 RepID=A0A3G9JKJ4_9BACL|nr:DMT family transporter [Paenibacillus baekrokdamisoli]MBB3068600.1 drug/metabolite transporter (DMT)-like permease [Paenibacillus baekrokdamisoli]BBH23434.1 transporter [Paenibacillus baekrokdamisoli]